MAFFSSVFSTGASKRRLFFLCVAIVLFAPNSLSVGFAGEPRMLPRPVHTTTVLVSDGKPRSIIIAPQRGPFAEAGRKVQEIVREYTGVTVPIYTPAKVTGKRGALLTSEAKKENLVFVGNIADNPALFEPYMRRFLVADQEEPGPDKFNLVTHPNPWGTGVGLLLIFVAA